VSTYHILTLTLCTGTTRADSLHTRFGSGAGYDVINGVQFRALVLSAVVWGPANAAECERLLIDACFAFFGWDMVGNDVRTAGQLNIHAGGDPQTFGLVNGYVFYVVFSEPSVVPTLFVFCWSTAYW
jgi:hypothetical protein